MTNDWQGDNPFCLIIKPDSGEAALIDLDRKGWLTEYSHLMRAAGTWILARKHGSVPVLVLHVADGEQPYYTKRHYTAFLPPVGVAGLTEIDMATLKEQASVQIYGIGKKLVTGQVNRMWVLPNGAICAGDDDGPLADQMAKQRLAAKLREKINGPDDGRGQGAREEANPEGASSAGQEGRGEGGQEGQGIGADLGRGDADGEGRGQEQANPGRGRADRIRGGRGRNGQGVHQRPQLEAGHSPVELGPAPGAVAEPGHEPGR